MEDRPRSGARRTPSDRPRPGGPPRGGPPGGGRSLSPDALLEMADELEQHARALLGQARQLQRMAAGLEGGGGRPSGPPRGSGGPGRSRQRPADQEERPRGEAPRGRSRKSEPEDWGSGGGGRRNREGAGRDAPNWAPNPKKRRP